ncbi:MAG: diguanylate cyclase [Elusimicrobia bacterium]|nr:diguanylate cyclase [Elusimicrobiota bacterium]
MKKAKILIVDDEPDILKGLKELLCSEGFAVRTTDCGGRVIKETRDFSPDLILMDVMLGDTDGYQVKEQLMKNIDTASIPVIFISVNKSLDFKRHSFASGGSDYIVKPFDADDLIIRIESILTRRKFYENMYTRDSLTGLHNKSIFEKQAKIQYSLSRQYGRPFSIAVIDINGLKDINRKYGHEAGDNILRDTAKVIKDMTRSMDSATRYSSDEFVILLPETDSTQAHAFLDRIKKRMKKAGSRHKGEIPFTISTGCSSCISGEINIERMFICADLSMHKEKTSGISAKNSVMIIGNTASAQRKFKTQIEAAGFSVKKTFRDTEEAIAHAVSADPEDAPGIIISALEADGFMFMDYVKTAYSKWPHTRVYLYTDRAEYLEHFPYIKDIVCGVIEDSQLASLAEFLEKLRCRPRL